MSIQETGHVYNSENNIPYLYSKHAQQEIKFKHVILVFEYLTYEKLHTEGRIVGRTKRVN